MGQKAEKPLSQKKTKSSLSKPQIVDLAIHSEDNPVLKKQQSTILVQFCFVPALLIPDNWHITFQNYPQA